MDNVLKIKTNVGSRVNLCFVGFERAVEYTCVLWV